MKFATAALSAAALGLVLAAAAHADTRSSNSKGTLEGKASPSAPKQDEEQAEVHSQPDNPHPGGTTPHTTTKAKRGTSSQSKGEKPTADKSSSAGSGAPAQDAQKEAAFKKLDLDGDGSISKAEAAGNEKLMNGFDQADKDRDGKLSRSEYANLGAPSPAKAKAKSAKAKAQAKPKTAADAR
jgi:hypothetical protein